MARIGAMVLALFFSSCSGCSAWKKRPSQILGESATPRFGFLLLPPTLADCEPRGVERAGKVVVYEFFASTCGYCAMMEQDMIALSEQYKESGLVIISISPEEWDEANNLVTPGGNRVLCSDQDIFRAWQIDGVPYFVVVDRRGAVLAILRGGGDGVAKRLKEYVEEAL